MLFIERKMSVVIKNVRVRQQKKMVLVLVCAPMYSYTQVV